MKKTLMIALAGMMLFAFTQCGDGGNDSKKDGENTEAKVSGSKEYQNFVAGYNELMKALKNAKDCDDLEKSIERIDKKYDKKFDEKDKVTEEEDEKVQKMKKEVEDLMMETAHKLGCF